MAPLRSIVICPDRALAQQFMESVSGLQEVELCRTLTAYPTPVELVRTLRTVAPDLVFLSFEEPDKAHEIVQWLEKEVAGLQVIAIHHELDPNILRETMRAGLREFVAFPFELRMLAESVGHVRELLERTPPDHQATSHIFSFVPSKAGVGTTTVALNVASALAQKGDIRVLLSDFDMNSGMLRFLLKLNNGYSVIDAVEHAMNMDEALWPQLVTSLQKLDVLHSGRINPSIRIEPQQIRSLIAFARRNYQALCFDHSGNLERYSLEIMQESKRVFIVCTPEIPSLHVAREKVAFLTELDLHSRLSVILNRTSKKPMFGKQQVEDVLGIPVAVTLPNDYVGVNNATAAGKAVEPGSDLGKQITSFALSLIDHRQPTSDNKKRFLEFFTPDPAVTR